MGSLSSSWCVWAGLDSTALTREGRTGSWDNEESVDRAVVGERFGASSGAQSVERQEPHPQPYLDRGIGRCGEQPAVTLEREGVDLGLVPTR